jgi:hypothetical protein
MTNMLAAQAEWQTVREQGLLEVDFRTPHTQTYGTGLWMLRLRSSGPHENETCS